MHKPQEDSVLMSVLGQEELNIIGITRPAFVLLVRAVREHLIIAPLLLIHNNTLLIIILYIAFKNVPMSRGYHPGDIFPLSLALLSVMAIPGAIIPQEFLFA